MARAAAPPHPPLLHLPLLLLFATLAATQEEEGRCPGVVAREAWGGRAPRRVSYQLLPLPFAVVQHTASPPCRSSGACVDRVRSIEAMHMDGNGWSDIGLSFLVGGDGRVYEGAGWTREGAHTIGFNRRSVGVALIGDFSDALPPRAQLDATRRLLECGVRRGLLDEDFKLLAHRQVAATQSPGLALFEELQTWPWWSPRP